MDAKQKKRPQKAIMQARMALYQGIRQFFSNRAVMEVETPILSAFGTTDLHIDSFSTGFFDKTFYLHTSPEFFMKQLLHDGYGDCFQIAKVFRYEPASVRHHYEFSLLEWYRLGFSLSELMAEVIALVKQLWPQAADYPVETITYRQAFLNIGVDPFLDDLKTVQDKTTALSGYRPQLADNKDEWLDFLLVTQVEQSFKTDTFIYLTHYPKSMASLAKTQIDAAGFEVAARFELYFNGIELANGFDELLDADEQAMRFAADNKARQAAQKPQIPADEDLVAALAGGMPQATGVALGLDRLLMLILALENLTPLLFREA